jgi:hypothetical protein
MVFALPALTPALVLDRKAPSRPVPISSGALPKRVWPLRCRPRGIPSILTAPRPALIIPFFAVSFHGDFFRHGGGFGGRR